jgi:hypothetical protein
MPAANLTQLYDFEGQFEAAAQAILADVLINSYVTGQDEQMPLLKTAIAFDVGPAQEGKFVQLEKPASWPAGMIPPQEYFIYAATLEYRVEVPRDDRQPTIAGVSSMLSQIRGKLREVMMQSVRPFNEVNLPLYKVARIRPNGSSTGQNATGNADVIFIRWDLTFEIRKTAWPAWVEA